MQVRCPTFGCPTQAAYSACQRCSALLPMMAPQRWWVTYIARSNGYSATRVLQGRERVGPLRAAILGLWPPSLGFLAVGEAVEPSSPAPRLVWGSPGVLLGPLPLADGCDILFGPLDPRQGELL